MKKRIKRILLMFVGAIVGMSIGGIAVSAAKDNKIAKEKGEFRKIMTLYMVFDQWLQIEQRGKSLVDYFAGHNYKTIAIYGMKELGERLYDELKQSDINVCYAIDKNASELYADIDIFTPDDELKAVDAIVVTAIYYFDEIKEELSKKVNYPIISLEDILNEI